MKKEKNHYKIENTNILPTNLINFTKHETHDRQFHWAGCGCLSFTHVEPVADDVTMLSERELLKIRYARLVVSIVHHHLQFISFFFDISVYSNLYHVERTKIGRYLRPEDHYAKHELYLLQTH